MLSNPISPRIASLHILEDGDHNKASGVGMRMEKGKLGHPCQGGVATLLTPIDEVGTSEGVTV